ncbi:chromosome segregation protein SMC [Psychrobacillus sp. AK 1817]|uniref:chromosome segregation protein SMC n=1 Tax=Psychrobacillus sp. AK 1817 TaxID=2303505 RepID=UPI0012475C5D|nr:chromosome segregation protein SMC [Psychrobacillus sp. AK 1817]QEY20202.1 chromosome segregation protein SMC [Psychrobacillus sp. AK 1817]
MFLKRLEIIGFKSFADRIGIDFVPGVTAVVGPNGSGKSNVTDAIRWVLGEQSAKSLRGAKMEDVIFAGSDSRKALNFAEVTLILDNSDNRVPLDFAEISVTRRVYRSGDSEYLLNKQQCRLKDITDLFMDSGLGKEAFSIISQGRVDEILNSRPEDRRTIFEETAGVLKYKQRKKKAEFKLIETDDNLNRVLDILHELDGRMEPLKIQSSLASDYLEMSTELKDIEIAVIAHDLNLFKQESAELHNQLQQIDEQKKLLLTQVSEAEADILTVRRIIGTTDEKLDKDQGELLEVSSELERLEGRKLLLAEKKQNASQQISQLKRALEEEKTKLQTFEKQLEENVVSSSEKKILLKELRAKKLQIDHVLSKSASEVEEEIENLKGSYIDLLNEEATMKNEMKHMEQQLQFELVSSEKMVEDYREIKDELEKLTNRKKEIEKQLETCQKNLAQKVLDFKSKRETSDKLEASYEEQQSMLQKAYQMKHQMQARKDSLEELESEFSGYFQGVKEVLMARDKKELKGIHGAVAELIQIPSDYMNAIDTAIGQQSQHIITDTSQDARLAIEWLKKKRVGRATFLPLQVMKSRKLTEQALAPIKQHPSFVNTADMLVNYNPDYKIIIESLLGNIIIATDLKGANEMAARLQYRYRFVTLDGDVVNAGGSLTGGSVKQQSSVFTRKAELEQLNDKLVELQQSVLQAEKSVSFKRQQVQQLKIELEEARLSGEALREEEHKLLSEDRECVAIISRLTNRLLEFDEVQTEKNHLHEDLVRKKEQTAKRSAEINESLNSIQQTIDQLQLLKQQSMQEKDQVQNELGELLSSIAVVNEQVNQQDKEKKQLEQEIQTCSQKIGTLEKEISWFENDDQSGPSPEEISQMIINFKEKKDYLIDQIKTDKEKRLVLSQKVNDSENHLKQLQQHVNIYANDERTLELRLGKLEVESNSLQNQLEETYELTLEEAKRDYPFNMDEELARKKVKLLKRSIEELGPINLGSIQEFEQVSERHSFLTEQREDLLSAQETLHEVIKEMDEEMTIRFETTFNEIQRNFKVVFRQLFGGGQADLVLTDPSSMLDTGIDIVAQPPGKKLQNLSLLSGGERALTAIALLFSILHTRPVPFCILDEVEAALDEANVTRYSDYLKKFSHDTQFIVITHRKGTMEGADVLYGITMQESGISKLVSVKLEEELVT